MHRLDQVLIGVGLIGLLAISAMMQAHTAEADFRLNVIAFEPSHDSTTLNKQPALDQFPAIVDLAQATQSNPADAQQTQAIKQRNKEIVQRYFEDWRNGTGNVFDLLTPDARFCGRCSP
jgi:uncharacterized protein